MKRKHDKVDGSGDIIFERKTEHFLEIIQCYNFTRTDPDKIKKILKCKRMLLKKIKKFKEEENKFIETMIKDDRKKLAEKENKEKEENELRLKVFLTTSEDAEIIDISNNLKLDDWSVLYNYKNMKAINITNNEHLSDLAIKNIAYLKFIRRNRYNI